MKQNTAIYEQVSKTLRQLGKIFKSFYFEFSRYFGDGLIFWRINIFNYNLKYFSILFYVSNIILFRNIKIILCHKIKEIFSF